MSGNGASNCILRPPRRRSLTERKREENGGSCGKQRFFHRLKTSVRLSGLSRLIPRVACRRNNHRNHNSRRNKSHLHTTPSPHIERCKGAIIIIPHNKQNTITRHSTIPVTVFADEPDWHAPKKTGLNDRHYVFYSSVLSGFSSIYVRTNPLVALLIICPILFATFSGLSLSIFT